MKGGCLHFIVADVKWFTVADVWRQIVYVFGVMSIVVCNTGIHLFDMISYFLKLSDMLKDLLRRKKVYI